MPILFITESNRFLLFISRLRKTTIVKAGGLNGEVCLLIFPDRFGYILSNLSVFCTNSPPSFWFSMYSRKLLGVFTLFTIQIHYTSHLFNNRISHFSLSVVRYEIEKT